MTDREERLREFVHGAEVVYFPPAAAARDEPPKKQRRKKTDPVPPSDGGAGDNGPLNAFGLPELCPIVPLGKEGNRYFYLDALGQIIVLAARDHSRNNLCSMFSPHTGLAQTLWSRKKQDSVTDEWRIVGFRVEACADALMDACARRGVWNLVEKVRGRGAWVDADGGLVLHCGRRLWTERGESPTGIVDDHVYPSEPQIPEPWPDPVRAASAGGPAGNLLEILKTWNWARPDGAVDATLLLGWLCAAMIGGALDWRPMVFVTGDKSSGKSTLHKLMEHLFDGGVIQAADTSAAGLYQHIKQASLPVAVDELEATADNKRSQAVIRLARLASSGGVMLRGGAEHTGVEFRARSCFLFSAILMPPLKAQDRSRMAILSLGKLDNRPPPELEPRAIREIGRKLRRRLLDQWGRFGETLQAYTQALAEIGHDARACDQFGALLACADLALSDYEPDREALLAWQEWLAPHKLRETADAKSNADACLDWLCQSQPESWRGGSKSTVAELVDKAGKSSVFADEADRAQAALVGGGLKVVLVSGRSYLAVPNAHRQVATLFEHSDWASEPGLDGGWSQALARLDQALINHVCRIGSRSTRCTCVPVDAVVTYAPEERRETADA